MNSITLVGHAGRDPELKFFESGSCVCNLRMAVRGRTKDDESDWFNLEIWGKTAQVAGDYVRKGSMIGIIGSVHEQKWTDRTTGEERSKTIVKVDKLELLGKKQDADAPAQAEPAAAAAPRPATTGWGAGPASTEEVPF